VKDKEVKVFFSCRARREPEQQRAATDLLLPLLADDDVALVRFRTSITPIEKRLRNGTSARIVSSSGKATEAAAAAAANLNSVLSFWEKGRPFSPPPSLEEVPEKKGERAATYEKAPRRRSF
jgi:hypothetical protein